jgi:hypothetical protein
VILNSRSNFFARYVASLICSLFLFSIATLAGPPLICHVFDIGSARSLPWVSSDWNLTGTEAYETRNLASDTIAVLDSDSTVLVHMETLRRATLYARKDPFAAKQLLTKLIARADAGGESAKAALATFDAGYLAEAYKQWMGKDQLNPAQGLDGYALVKNALQSRKNDAQMEFAAALITLQGPADEHETHARTALVGAKNDALLARNLARRFHGTQTETMADLLSSDEQVKAVAQP